MTDTTDQGRTILEVVNSMRRVYADVATLLGTVEDLMGAAEWEPATDATCWTDTSFSLRLPDRWSPREVFRFFKTDNARTVLVVVSVLLENRRDKGTRPFEEPMVETTWFDFAPEEPGPQSKKWKWWYSRWHSFLDGYDPEVWVRNSVEDFPEKERVAESYQFKTVSSRVVPLARVTDAEVLKSLVVQPLLDDLAAQRHVSSKR